jgi:hypothetical protein
LDLSDITNTVFQSLFNFSFRAGTLVTNLGSNFILKSVKIDSVQFSDSNNSIFKLESNNVVIESKSYSEILTASLDGDKTLIFDYITYLNEMNETLFEEQLKEKIQIHHPWCLTINLLIMILNKSIYDRKFVENFAFMERKGLE